MKQKHEGSTKYTTTLMKDLKGTTIKTKSEKGKRTDKLSKAQKWLTKAHKRKDGNLCKAQMFLQPEDNESQVRPKRQGRAEAAMSEEQSEAPLSPPAYTDPEPTPPPKLHQNIQIFSSMQTPTGVKTRSQTGGVGGWSTKMGRLPSLAPTINNMSEKGVHMFPLIEVANPAYPGHNGGENGTDLVTLVTRGL